MNADYKKIIEKINADCKEVYTVMNILHTVSKTNITDEQFLEIISQFKIEENQLWEIVKQAILPQEQEEEIEETEEEDIEIAEAPMPEEFSKDSLDDKIKKLQL